MGMSVAPRTSSLSCGLRALELLAVHAPIDLGGFAELSGISPDDALALLSAFEQTGYVARIPECALFVLTPLALNSVPPGKPAGRLH